MTTRNNNLSVRDYQQLRNSISENTHNTNPGLPIGLERPWILIQFTRDTKPANQQQHNNFLFLLLVYVLRKSDRFLTSSS